MNFIFEQILTGGDRNFGYLIGDRKSKEAALIDPSYDPQRLIDRAEAQHLQVKWIINTHGHDDHTNGNEEAQQATGAKIAIHESSQVPHDLSLTEGQKLLLGTLPLRILHTPGHCDDHITIHIVEHQIALTGDLLFVGKIGGTWSDADTALQFQSLRRLIDELPATTTIWPGHNYGCRPSSTLALERAVNPFLESMEYESFLAVKNGWKALKEANGLI